VTTFEKSSYFSTGQVTHYNVIIFEKSSYFFKHQAGRLEQLDHLRNSSHSFIIGRLPKTISSIKKKQTNKTKTKKKQKKNKKKQKRVGHRSNDLFLDFNISL